MKESRIIAMEASAAPEQISAAKVKIRNQSENIFKAAAKPENAVRRRRGYRRRMTTMLRELDKANSQSEQSWLVEPSYETEPPHKTARVLIEQEKAREIYAAVAPQLRANETEIMQRAAELGPRERIRIAAGASMGITRMTSDQREDLLKTLGSTKEEAVEEGKKIGVSIALGSVTGTAAFLGVNFLAGLQKFYPLIHHITDWKMAVSYAAFYGSTALAAITNKKLLDEPAIKTSANAFPTAAYYILPKFFAEQKKKIVEKTGVWAGTFFTNVTGEFLTWGIIGPFAGLQGVMGRNIGSTIAELATVGGNLGWLHYNRRKAAKTGVEKPLAKKNSMPFLKREFFVDLNQHGYATDTTTIDNYYSTAKP